MFDVVDLTEECRRAAGAEVVFASDEELLAGAVGLQAARSALDAAEAHVLGELRARGVTDRCFGLKTSRWVAAQARVDRRPIARRERLGAQLRHLPEVDAAVAEGSISFDHAAVVAEGAANPRIGDQIAAPQRVWVELAMETSFVDWKHQLEQTVALLDQDGGFDPERERARNRLRFSELPDGLTRLTGDLVGAEALVTRQCVEARADRLFRQLNADETRTPDLPLPSRATLLALALAELVRAGSAVDRERTAGPAVDVTLVIEATQPITPLTLRATHDGDGDGGRSDAVLDPDAPIDWMANALIERCGPVHIPDGGHVHPDVAASLLCDPLITALIVDSLGVPLDLGREVRLANRRQRRALGRRDGGCVFPGCDAPASWCDAHHVTWWHEGGPTDIDNLALLCRYHHGVSHRRGWTMTATTDQWFTITTPSGQTLPSQRHRGRSPTAHPACTPTHA